MLPDLNLDTRIGNLGAALNILTAMITPALLVSACGTLILSTSNRLARVIDRLRKLSEHVERLANTALGVELRGERLAFWRDEIDLQGARLYLLQRAQTQLYLAVAAFVFTSVAIGVVSVSFRFYWIPVALGVAGALLMLSASVTLLLETRKSVRGMVAETEFHLKLAHHHTALSEEIDLRPPEVSGP
jgi:phage gp46-like protein